MQASLFWKMLEAKKKNKSPDKTSLTKQQQKKKKSSPTFCDLLQNVMWGASFLVNDAFQRCNARSILEHDRKTGTREFLVDLKNKTL